MRWTVITNCDSFFITKCDTVYYKLRQVLQSAMNLLQIATGITKCDDYYKLRQVLQSAMIITNCDSTSVTLYLTVESNISWLICFCIATFCKWLRNFEKSMAKINVIMLPTRFQVSRQKKQPRSRGSLFPSLSLSTGKDKRSLEARTHSFLALTRCLVFATCMVA